MSQVRLRHEVLKLLQVLLLQSLQLSVPVIVRLAFFLLILSFRIKAVSVSLHLMIDLFLVPSLHIARILLDLVHCLATLKLFLVHLPDQILSLLLVFEHKSGLFLLSVTIFRLDRLL